MIVLTNIKIVEKVMARTRGTNSAKVIPVITVVTGGNKEEYGLAVDAIKKAVRKNNRKSDRKIGYVIMHSS